jgi:actin related protein 2/3 complex subunit 4
MQLRQMPCSCRESANYDFCSANKELLMNPLVVSRNKNERVLIETAINSVRISIKVKQADEMEEILCNKFMRFLCQRAEQFVILRRKPVQVTN